MKTFPAQWPKSWYVVAELRELSTRKLNAIRRFGRDWIVRMTRSGRWIMQEDRCPHRSAKLSLGRIVDDCVSCPFHGFRFDPSGKCTLVPEVGREAPGLKIETYELEISQGFLWLSLCENKRPIPWFEELDASFTYSWSKRSWKKHFTRCVENQLDYVHLPYVHATTIGIGFDPAVKAVFELNDERLKVNFSQKPTDNAYFEFRFGNIWKLNISERMKQTLAFVPVDDFETLIYLRTYHRFTRIPGFKQILAWILMPFNFIVLNQDHGVVLSQEPNDALSAKEERLFPSDRAIQAFRKVFGET